MTKRVNIEFSKVEKEQYKAIVLEKLKEGWTYDAIAEFIGISNKTVRDMRDILIGEGKITVNEIDRIKEQKRQEAKDANQEAKKVLEGLKEGKSQKKIAEELYCSPMKINRIVKELIEKGEISREEIKQFSKKNLKRKELEDNICRMLKEGSTYEDIKNELRIADRTIYVIKKRLVEEGSLTEEEANSFRSKKRKIATEYNDDTELEDKVEEISEDLKSKVLSFLLKGVNPWKICRKLDIDAITLNKIKGELIKDQRINTSQIKEARSNRRKNDKEKVYKLLIQGYSGSEMTKLMDDVPNYINNLISELIKEGRITAEKINEYRFNNNKKPFLDHVLIGLKEGRTYQEIADGDESKYLTKTIVKRFKEELVANSKITEAEIEAARKKGYVQRKKQIKIDNIEKYDNRILELFRLGFNQNEICLVLELSNDYVRSRKRVLFLREKLSSSIISSARKNKERKANTRRTSIKKRFNAASEQNANVVQSHIEYCKAQFKLGEINIEDVMTLGELISNTPELMTLTNINLIARCYIKLDNIKEALIFINQCIYSFEGDQENLSKLKKIRDEIQFQEKKRHAKRLLAEGILSIEDISEKAGLSTVDVVRIKKEQDNNSKNLRER